MQIQPIGPLRLIIFSGILVMICLLIYLVISVLIRIKANEEKIKTIEYEIEKKTLDDKLLAKVTKNVIDYINSKNIN
jgi:hypothetical protein|tara:strand:+ start:14805 stop:15035 length:231 start_codon:yes stop_codon:yes gene_type:complete